jgi:hypothetical protein
MTPETHDGTPLPSVFVLAGQLPAMQQDLSTRFSGDLTELN